jgi:hypothetical protein
MCRVRVLYFVSSFVFLCVYLHHIRAATENKGLTAQRFLTVVLDVVDQKL